jgi:hypothetical protein
VREKGLLNTNKTLRQRLKFTEAVGISVSLLEVTSLTRYDHVF